MRALLIQKGVKLYPVCIPYRSQFESFVNSEGCKAGIWKNNLEVCLRALLIQKGVKHHRNPNSTSSRLRALLIQKGVKQCHLCTCDTLCLRALLIQKGVKLTSVTSY